jgi:hypothetical protein
MVIRYMALGAPAATSKGDARFERDGGARLTDEMVSLPKTEAKPREIYLGGKTAERLKPWLITDPPTSRRTWFRNRKKEQGK